MKKIIGPATLAFVVLSGTAVSSEAAIPRDRKAPVDLGKAHGPYPEAVAATLADRNYDYECDVDSRTESLCLGLPTDTLPRERVAASPRVSMVLPGDLISRAAPDEGPQPPLNAPPGALIAAELGGEATQTSELAVNTPQDLAAPASPEPLVQFMRTQERLRQLNIFLSGPSQPGDFGSLPDSISKPK